MTDSVQAFPTGDLATRKTAAQREEVLRAALAGKQVVFVDPAASAVRQRPVIVDEAWQFMPKPHHPAWALARYRRPAPLAHALADLGDEARDIRFLQSLSDDVTAGPEQPA